MSIYGNPVMMGGPGGGGGSTNILSGVTPPSSSQGSDGAVYLQYKGPAPTGYLFIDYLEFVYGSYIDLNIVPSNHKLIMVADDYRYTNDKHWFGTTAGSKYFNFTPYNNKYYWGNNGAEGNSPLGWSAGKKTLVFNGDNNEKTLDGTVLDSGTFAASTASLEIGRRDNAANAAYFRVYSVKLWDKTSGDLVRDMIPVKRISDNTLGLHDLANDVFYPNSGTGTFIYGEELTERAIVASQAKVSGAWQDLIGTRIDDIDLGGGGITLLTRAQWDALSTAQKQAYGLLAIQDADSGFDRGELVYGADYRPVELLQSGTAKDSITVNTTVTGHYKLFVLAINSEASSYALTIAASLNGNDLTVETSEHNNYSSSGSNQRNYRMNVYDLQTTAGDTLEITLETNNNYSSFVFGIIDADAWTFSKALTTPDNRTSGSNTASGIAVYGTFAGSSGGTINVVMYAANDTVTTENPGTSYKSSYIFWFS